jgi:8-oxo-dGTP pyrophosphatase MutT (NUDIX family)
MGGDGDGFAQCAQGHTHWGRFGASGLLAYHRDAGGEVSVLLQQRAWWGIGGGTWGMFGGALHSHEDPVGGALRETAEECTLDTGQVTVHGVRLEDHGGWSFVSVIGSLPGKPEVRPASRETSNAAWVPLDKVTDKRLFEPFARSWPLLRNGLKRLVLVVDAANVVGARADGWWKDRAGANARLRDDLAVLKDDGVSGLPKDSFPLDSYFPEVVLVVEGEARRVADEPADGVRVVAAPGRGPGGRHRRPRAAGPLRGRRGAGRRPPLAPRLPEATVLTRPCSSRPCVLAGPVSSADLVAGLLEGRRRFGDAVLRDEDEVRVVRGGDEDRQPGLGERAHQRGQHPGRRQVVRCLAVEADPALGLHERRDLPDDGQPLGRPHQRDPLVVVGERRVREMLDDELRRDDMEALGGR